MRTRTPAQRHHSPPCSAVLRLSAGQWPSSALHRTFLSLPVSPRPASFTLGLASVLTSQALTQPASRNPRRLSRLKRILRPRRRSAVGFLPYGRAVRGQHRPWLISSFFLQLFLLPEFCCGYLVACGWLDNKLPDPSCMLASRAFFSVALVNRSEDIGSCL